MLILGLDTATAMSTVAVSERGRIVEQSTIVGNRHAETTPTQLQAVLRQAELRPDQLDLIVVGVGPGPYTSLRVGIALANALGLSTRTPVVGCCTLDVIAAQVVREQAPTIAFGVATDARRREVYWAGYRPDGRRMLGPLVGRPDTVLARGDAPAIWAGDGFDRFAQLAREAGLGEVAIRHPSAALLIEQARALLPPAPWSPGQLLARYATGDQDRSRVLDDKSGDGATAFVPRHALLPPLPLYLRRPDARPPTSQRSQRAAAGTTGGEA